VSEFRRRLIVMRHAKSSWSSPATTDHARPLNDRGRQDAPRVAARLVELNWHPEFILSSDAQRTRETAERMRGAWKREVPEEFTPLLFHAGYEGLADVISIVPDDVAALLVLGHNPGWQELVLTLSGASVEMKTATAALLLGSGEHWSDALRNRRRWELVDVVYPREIE
jgi:phosphohistidine phosphatase